ncbi:thiol reductant ABC exporter subunit CydC [Clostridium sp. C2-6-12]|uniref:thiol reductant ABC exporter subunit CydC n=1 Tax=Clostridium sp. C2-6-12 TaxID=2698832 RepID=UPI00136D4391|nr:thiol reductant ABC exporter subunit CydC [Clostridium sp. C2-6-12]
MRILKVMNSLMKKQLFFVICSLIMGVCTILSNVGLLSTSAVLISRAALHPDVLDLMVLIVGVRFFGIFRGVFRYFERILSHDATFRILSSIRKWFYKNFNEGYSENIKFKTGDIYTKAVTDVDVLKDFYLRGIYPLIIAVLTGIATGLFILCFSDILAYIYWCGYIIAGFIFPIIIFKLNNKFLEKEINLKNSINSILLDSFKGILEINIYPLKLEIIQKFQGLSKQLSKVQKKKNLINALGSNFHSMVAIILMGASLMITAPLVINRELDGIYYAMLPLTILASFEALLPMVMVMYKFKETFESGENIFSIIDNKSNEEIQLSEEIADYDISVKNLSVYDDEAEKYIIKNLSFKLPHKKKLGIVGLSGSGKSTIVKALLGFIKYQEGDIFIGETSYKNTAIDNIRKLFTVMEQNPYVFNTSIRENLLIANKEAEENEMINLLEKFQINNLIKESDEGLDSLLGQFGYNISGGEKQRLMLVRTFLKQSKIAILDEPTSSLDKELEKKIVEAIHDEIKEKSCIWITHRLVEMDRFDEILVFEEGKVIEKGTHQELINLKGRYYEFWILQNQYLNM